MQPPTLLDGAKVLAVADLREATPTGYVRHFDEHGQQEAFAFLALAAYEGGNGVYLFYCDRDWEVQNDTLHRSEQDAEAWVAREFVGGVNFQRV